MSVLGVDDNAAIIDALRIKLARAGGFAWQGALSCADDLVETAIRLCPVLVLLDLDMPGKDPFAVLAELVEKCPDTKVVIFSGHVRSDLVHRAIDAGAWGYVSKNDGADDLISALRRIAVGELALSPEAQRVYSS